jgi:uncharacterized protein
MKIFDFNIHLPLYLQNEVNEKITEETTLNFEQLATSLNGQADSLQNIAGANFMLFNTSLFDLQNEEVFKEVAQRKFKSVSYTALIDFRRNDLLEYLEKVRSAGVRCIKFHCYVQKISDADYTLIYRAVKYAETHKMIICIDTSFGTSKMYHYDNMKLACFVADITSGTPIILLHSGGLRTFEAMLLAEEKKNVFLETSFSLPYYLGSSLESDFAFVYKKLGSHRIIYGSDSPYIQSDESIGIHQNFFEKYRFTDSQNEEIMYSNAINLLFYT